jgi:hypothetical protein
MQNKNNYAENNMAMSIFYIFIDDSLIVLEQKMQGCCLLSQGLMVQIPVGQTK